MDACGCEGWTEVFDRAGADGDLERYRRSGPDPTTGMLLRMLGSSGVQGATVLDIGGGIGVIDHELLKAGAGHAVLVEGSQPPLQVAREAAEAAGLLDRLEPVEGDFVRVADRIERAEIVTLDRVICCYPDVEALVKASSAKAKRLYGLVLPRDRWLVRAAIRLMNISFSLRRRRYRAYAHSNDRIDGLVAAQGLRPQTEAGTWFWRVVVYERATGT